MAPGISKSTWYHVRHPNNLQVAKLGPKAVSRWAY